MYPYDWPRCITCGDYALDGKATCGRVECSTSTLPLVDYATLELRMLAAANANARKHHPLPRCLHGNALADHSGAHLEPECGCRLRRRRT